MQLQIRPGLALLAVAAQLLIASVQCAIADAIVLQAEVAVQAGNVNQQLRAQFEPAVKVELSFAIRAAKLEGDQRQQLIAAGEKWLDEYVSVFNKQQPQQAGIRVFAARAAPNRNADPRAAITKGIADVARKVLTPEQMKSYERECVERDLFYRQAIIATLVGRMDERLALSAEQQEKLSASLLKDWDTKWAPPLELFMYNNDIWPPIPDKLVLPHLTHDQWLIWTRIAKNAQHVNFGFNMGNAQQVIDDVEFEKNTEPQPPANALFVPAANP